RRGRTAIRHALHLDRARRCPGRRAPGRYERRRDRAAGSHRRAGMTGAPTSLALRGGVIAAGHGTRLRADGYRVSKPMTPVGGRPLIEHALDRFRAVGVRQAIVIVNEESDDCRRWLADYRDDLDLDVIVRTTPSSYASFALVAATLTGAPAVITTVDAIMALD